MPSIVNPTGLLYLDIIYYFIILRLGPVLGIQLLLFQPKRQRLHDAYRNSGVEVLGMITHRKVTVRRGSLTRIERSRTHEIRYAYKAPSENDSSNGGNELIYIKGFVAVKEEYMARRLILIVVLPGQPTSGVPKFLIPKRSVTVPEKVFWAVASLAFTVYCTLVFALLVAGFVQRDTHCIATSAKYSGYSSSHPKHLGCYMSASSYILAFLVILVLGFLGALAIYGNQLSVIPGKMWKVARCPQRRGTNADDSNIPVATATPLGRPPSTMGAWRQYETTDNRAEIPFAEAAAILGSDEIAAEATIAIQALEVPEAEPASNNNDTGVAMREVQLTPTATVATVDRCIEERTKIMPEATVAEIV